MSHDGTPADTAQTSQPRRSREPWGSRRAVGRCAIALTALGLSALLVLPWADILAGNIVPVLQALIVVWIVAAVAGFLVALVCRSPFAVGAMALPLVLAAAPAWLLTSRPSGPTLTGERHALTVVSLNAKYGEATVDSTMNLVRQRHPDVLILVEMTAGKLAALDAAGLRGLLPHRTTGLVDDGSRGSVVLSRYAVRTVDADVDLGPYDLQEPTASVAAPAGPVLVRAIHSYPPLRNGVAAWRPQLRHVGTWQRAQTCPRLIVAGDFNAGVAHPVFRSLARGLVDAYPAVHGSWTPTWPRHGLMPPFVQIDHVLTKGFDPKAAGITSVDGTDHAAVWTILEYGTLDDSPSVTRSCGGA